jgi:hypothetical protein
MTWRTSKISTYTVVFIGALLVTYAARSAPSSYRLEVTPRGPQAAQSLVMSCSENALCRGRIELLIGEKMQPVTVVALFEPGNAFIKFEACETPLFISQQKYG